MSTPYAGTEGFSGTDTSRERAESKAASAKRRQNAMLRYLRERGSYGATVVDVKDAGRLVVEKGLVTHPLTAEFEHHGTASGTLSILHRAGAIARLVETRDKAHVYVLPEHIDGRPFERFVGNVEKAQIAALDDAVAEIERERSKHSPVDRLGMDVATAMLRARIRDLAAGTP
ncbi:DNA binding protein [Microbacterium phage Blett]|nr:DNA binding protein [Microbacterium phage Blett]